MGQASPTLGWKTGFPKRLRKHRHTPLMSHKLSWKRQRSSASRFYSLARPSSIPHSADYALDEESSGQYVGWNGRLKSASALATLGRQRNLKGFAFCPRQ
jgi:hypothetical protein